MFKSQCWATLLLAATLGCGEGTVREDKSAAEAIRKAANAEILAALPEAAGIKMAELDAMWGPDRAPPVVTDPHALVPKA